MNVHDIVIMKAAVIVATPIWAMVALDIADLVAHAAAKLASTVRPRRSRVASEQL